MAEKKPKSDDDPPVPSKRKRKVRDKEEGQQQAISKTSDYKRRKVEIPRKLAAATVVPPVVSRGALSSIPSDPAALSETEPGKRPPVSSVSQNSCTLGFAGEPVVDPDRPIALSAHRLHISGAADVEYPVAQLDPVAWCYPPANFPLLPPVWGPTGTFESQHPEKIPATLGTEAETSIAARNHEGVPTALGTGIETSTAVSNPVDFDFWGEWLDFGDGA